ncbi:hypothetical protein Tco_0097324 [Tanacetum coccineum]
MLEMQSFLHVSTSLAESFKLLEKLQDFESEKCRDLMKSISETQLKVLKKLSFIAKLRRQTNEKPENYVIFEVNYDGVFNLHPLSTPRSSLEEGLTIAEDDFDMNKMYDMGEKMMQNAGLMSLEELIAWGKKEAGSPFIADKLGLHDNWLYKGLSLDGLIDAGGQVVLKKKKGRSMVKVTRKRKHQYYKKINRFMKVGWFGCIE